MNSRRRAELLAKFERATEWPLTLLALAMIPILAVPLLTTVSGQIDAALEGSLWVIWAIFAADLTIRTYLAEPRLPYLARHWYDVMIVVIPFLRPLRIVRSARALRVLRLWRLTPFVARVWTSTHQLLRRRGLQYVLMMGLVAILAAAAVVMLVERQQGGEIDDYGTALWWAIATMTTVGYGDAVPATAEGRAIAVFVMVVGITFFSWVTANIAAYLVESDKGREGNVTLTDLMRKLEVMEEDIRQLRREIRGSTAEEGPLSEATGQ